MWKADGQWLTRTTWDDKEPNVIRTRGWNDGASEQRSIYGATRHWIIWTKGEQRDNWTLKTKTIISLIKSNIILIFWFFFSGTKSIPFRSYFSWYFEHDSTWKLKCAWGLKIFVIFAHRVKRQLLLKYREMWLQSRSWPVWTFYNTKWFILLKF